MSPEETLKQWQAKHDAMRDMLDSGKASVGVAKPEQVIGLSGIELFQRMMRGELPWAPIAQTLDFFVAEAEVGRVVFQGRPHFSHYNPLGTVHGGWYATLLDSALACAVHSTLPAGKSYTTLELKVNMVRALTDKVPMVRAEGIVIHVGGQVATSEGKLYGPDGKLYAHASTTCLIFDFPPKK